jgi:hypothetical protein
MLTVKFRDFRYALAGSFHVYKEASCTLLSCVQAFFVQDLKIHNARVSRIDIQQSIVNATNYTVPNSFMIILEHKTILDIHHIACRLCFGQSVTRSNSFD